MIRRVFTSLFVASAFAVGLGTLPLNAAQSANLGIYCDIGVGELIPLIIGEANPAALEEEQENPFWPRPIIESQQHATDICINHLGGKPHGRIKA